MRQLIRNDVENIVVLFGGFAEAGVGLAQSLLSIPGVTVEAVQQVLALAFVGAFDTIATAIRDGVIAVGQPLLDSLIWRNQKASAVQTALYAAVPDALIAVANGFLAAGNGVATSFIVGAQNLVAAILTLNLGNIVDAAVEGTTNFLAALGAGAGAIVSGSEAAQLGIATALATEPPAPAVADVAALQTLSVDATISLARSRSVAVDPIVPKEESPTVDADVSGLAITAPDPDPEEPMVKDAEPSPSAVADVKDAAPEADPKDSPEDSEPSPSTDSPSAATTPTKKPVHTKPLADAPKDAEGTVTKAPAGVRKDGSSAQGASTDKGDAGAKPASECGHLTWPHFGRCSSRILAPSGW